MKIACQQGNAMYNIPEDRIPDRKAVFTCKRCRGEIVLNAGTPEQASPKEYRVMHLVGAMVPCPVGHHFYPAGRISSVDISRYGH